MSKDEWKKLNKNEWTKWVGVVGRMLLAYALVFAQGAWATQSEATKDKAASPQKAAAQQANEKQPAAATAAIAQSKQTHAEKSESAMAEEKPSGDGRHEGIKVHGHWTIEVRNPDGTVVTHTEFENAYVGGTNTLPNILHRDATVGGWYIGMIGSACGNVGCTITEAASGIPAGSNTLVVSLLFPSPIQLVLSGTFQVGNTGTIGSVVTSVGQCSSSVLPSVCLASVPNANNNSAQSLSLFTSAVITPSPVSVSAGQTVAVTVNISFS